MTTPKPKLRIGDLFTVPLDDERLVIGQIVATYLRSHYFAIFEPTFRRDEDIDLDAVRAARVELLVPSYDAKFRVGDWVIIGNRPVAADMPLPAYKVGRSGGIVIEDYSGTRRRPARGDEAEWVPFRRYVSPANCEDAVHAGHGLEPWNEAFEGLEPSPESTAAKLFGGAKDPPAKG